MLMGGGSKGCLVNLLMVQEEPRASKEQGAQGSSLLTSGRGSRHNKLPPAGRLLSDQKVTNFIHQLKNINKELQNCPNEAKKDLIERKAWLAHVLPVREFTYCQLENQRGTCCCRERGERLTSTRAVLGVAPRSSPGGFPRSGKCELWKHQCAI